MSDRYVWSSYIKGPRTAGLRECVKDRVWADSQLELTKFEEEKRFLRTTVRFEVKGPLEAIKQLQRDLATGIEEYNSL